ncbi:MAG TPA: PQQ-dependent sugar dehydrogenase, partial [Polyangiaceae bacterium]|nr:PQQ-dependent sugar dehydrogenase [Polyangiaceae bacterium]
MVFRRLLPWTGTMTLLACGLLSLPACSSDSPTQRSDGDSNSAGAAAGNAPGPGVCGTKDAMGDSDGSGGSQSNGGKPERPPESSVGGGATPAGSEGGASTAGGCPVAGASGESTSGGSANGGSGGMASGESFTKRVLVESLASPWEISWGPDGWLWVTERTGKRVVRVRPSDGTRSVAVQIDEVRQEGSQDGLLGMALHPQLMAGTGQDYVYVAYSYDSSDGPRFKIRRFTYDTASATLTEPRDVLSGLPASTDHNSGRLLVGPDARLYYTIGDQGENQFERKCNLDRAQELPSQAQLDAADYQT